MLPIRSPGLEQNKLPFEEYETSRTKVIDCTEPSTCLLLYLVDQIDVANQERVRSAYALPTRLQ